MNLINMEAIAAVIPKSLNFNFMQNLVSYYSSFWETVLFLGAISVLDKYSSFLRFIKTNPFRATNVLYLTSEVPI